MLKTPSCDAGKRQLEHSPARSPAKRARGQASRPQVGVHLLLDAPASARQPDPLLLARRTQSVRLCSSSSLTSGSSWR